MSSHMLCVYVAVLSWSRHHWYYLILSKSKTCVYLRHMLMKMYADSRASRFHKARSA